MSLEIEKFVTSELKFYFSDMSKIQPYISDLPIEYQNQIIMPCLSSINNVNEFIKYNTNTMKITYILEDY